MKQILSLLLFVTICVVAHAEWLYCGETDTDVYYVNADIRKDYSGYYLVWVKEVTKSSALKQKRQELYRDYKKKGFLKYTHAIAHYKYDLRANCYKYLSLTNYSSGGVISTVQLEYRSNWEYPIPDSVGEDIFDTIDSLIEDLGI